MRAESLEYSMHAVAAPAETPATTRGASEIDGATTSQKPACHQQRLPPPAKTTCSNGVVMIGAMMADRLAASTTTPAPIPRLDSAIASIAPIASRAGSWHAGPAGPDAPDAGKMTDSMLAIVHPPMQNDPTLRLIACGGTFDKRYDPIAGTLAFGTTQLQAIVERARLTIPVVVEPLMQVDSLDMTDADRDAVLASCRAAPERAIVIVHGTDTMPQTAAVLGPCFEASDGRTIVLTGAMVPYAIAGSDALFNLGFACACAETLAPGTWIAMNGRVHRWNAVRKNREAGVFEAV